MKKRKRRYERIGVALELLVWIRKKKRVDALKQQLRDGVAAVQLEISSVGL